VPLRARAALLKEARHHGAFTAASFVSGEMETVRRGALLKLVDLLAVNIDEAAVLGNVRHREKAADIVEACVASIRKLNPGLSLTITNGGAGAWAWHDGTLRHLPSLKVPVVNAAGAGDAWLAGLMLGLIRGLPFAAAGKTATCMRLARLVSAMSVLSADTIHFGITLKSLAAFGRKHGESDLVRRLLQG
jgi:sugar/nucleoside kinase (ribokinase family)